MPEFKRVPLILVISSSIFRFVLSGTVVLICLLMLTLNRKIAIYFSSVVKLVKLGLMMLLVMALSVSAFVIPAHGADVSHAEFTLDLNCFQPTKITFNYLYTHYASIYDISTIGNSTYTYTGTATTFQFLAEQVDNYFFTFELRYNQTVNQTILVGFWSGTMAMQGLDYASQYQDVIFHVRLRITQQPSYPSENDVARAVVSQVQKNIDALVNEMNDREKRYETTLVTVVIVSVVAVSGSIIGTLLHIAELRRHAQAR